MTTATITIQTDSGPRNARTDPDSGLRWYRWQDREVVSVTSARSMAGLSFNLAAWQLARVCDRATLEHGTLTGMLNRERRKRERNLEENRVKEARAWLRAAPEELRDYAATRGNAVHEAAEKAIPVDWIGDYRKVKLRVPLLDEFGVQQVTDAGTKRIHTIERRGYDLVVPEGAEIVSDMVIPAAEIADRVRQDRDWLAVSGAEILLTESQVWNLTLGYAGSFDRLVRFPNGELWIIDLKTGDQSFSDYVLQQCGYLMAEFVGADDVINEPATKLLHQVSGVGILHLHADSWEFLRLSIDERTWAAFRGLLAFATWTSDHASEDTFVVARRRGSDQPTPPVIDTPAPTNGTARPAITLPPGRREIMDIEDAA